MRAFVAVVLAFVLGLGAATQASTVDDLNACQTMCIVMGTRDMNYSAEHDCPYLGCVAGCLCSAEGYTAMTDPWTLCTLERLSRFGCV